MKIEGKQIFYTIVTNGVSDEMKQYFIENHEKYLPYFIDNVELYTPDLKNIGVRLKVPLSIKEGNIGTFSNGIHTFSDFTINGAKLIALRVIENEICLDFEWRTE